MRIGWRNSATVTIKLEYSGFKCHNTIRFQLDSFVAGVERVKAQPSCGHVVLHKAVPH